ncbi:MAG: hypothetical protein ACK6AD_15600 [Cyanobacteriota bacterium]|jgi:hypothetical protein
MKGSLSLGCLLVLLAGVLLMGEVVAPPLAWAGPVEWHEVPATAEGRQWWDAGSLRLSREGQLTVLSRFQPATPTPATDAPTGRAPASTLYVMELDCGQELYRDTSVNGLPRFRAEWQAVAGDSLSREILRAACQAGTDLLASAASGASVGG